MDTRAGHYGRKLHTKAGEVTLKVPKVRSDCDRHPYRIRHLVENTLGIILLASLNPVFTASERHRNSKDRLLARDPRYPGITPYEYKIGVRLRKEINDILGFEN